MDDECRQPPKHSCQTFLQTARTRVFLDVFRRWQELAWLLSLSLNDLFEVDWQVHTLILAFELLQAYDNRVRLKSPCLETRSLEEEIHVPRWLLMNMRVNLDVSTLDPRLRFGPALNVRDF